MSKYHYVLKLQHACKISPLKTYTFIYIYMYNIFNIFASFLYSFLKYRKHNLHLEIYHC